MIRVAIAGGTGYTGGELIRILLNHPEVELVAATTTSSDGVPVASIHRDLIGETELCFGTELGDPDVIFLCLGHGISRQFMDTYKISPNCKIIDIGNDFRLDGNYKGREFVYGLCESAKAKIIQAQNVANPGCFATGILLGLLPLAHHNLLKDEIHVTAITGSTGAGKTLSDTTHFTYRTANVSIYKLFNHQHLAEIHKCLAQKGVDSKINFVPMRGDFARGIFSSIYTRAVEGWSQEDYRKIFNEYYAASPFVFHSNEDIAMKEVVNTNKALVHVELHNGYVHIATAIDNLVKGAAGQAVQNMNLIFGLPEDMGLKLKPSAF